MHDPKNKVLIEVIDVHKSFLGVKGREIKVLNGISFHVKKGEFVCLLGPTGCGKTTLLRIISGLERQDKGIVKVNVENRGGVGFMFQKPSLFPWRTVLKNVEFGLELKGVPKEQRKEIALKYLSLVGMEKFSENYPHELSGGMEKRVTLARSLATDPDVLLMDEPFVYLDAQTRNTLQEEIISIWEKTRKTVIFVTHSVDEAVFLADRVLLMTALPSTIKEEFPVTLKRPRDRTSPEFVEIRKEVLRSLRKEVEKASVI